MAMKSLTGSRKVITMLNHLGHCISYNGIEELETELTYGCSKANRVTPSGMSMDRSCCMGLAWDNYDRFTETLSGKDALHDTVGIAYETVVSKVGQEMQSTVEGKDGIDLQVEGRFSAEELQSSSLGRKRKRRLYEASGLNIEPYRKKPKMMKFALLPLSDERRIEVPHSFKTAQQHNFLWIADFTFNNSSKDVPMWVGWHSKYGPREESIQKVWYLKQMNESRASTTVVAETLKRSQKVA